MDLGSVVITGILDM